MVVLLRIASLLLVVAIVIPPVAHALEMPGKLRLGLEQYRAVQPIYYPGFTIIGAGLQSEELSSGARRFFGASASVSETDWMVLRDRWEWSHLYRAAASVSALILLAVALLIC